MVFSSLLFLLLFLPLLLILYFIGKNLKWRNAVLLLFSLVFYAWGEPKWILCMLGATVINYICALVLEKASSPIRRKVVLALGVIASLAALFYFKYASFFMNTVAELFGVNWRISDVQLPIGLSFYTFQILTYTVDVYRGKVPQQKNLSRLLLSVSCFP
ncbi:MAG: MBOAT family protein, partial [Clostridia bacterium]|nr:MBOAT family protein [Clostridia bacterium]